MFTGLNDLSMVRSTKQAIGFYIAYLLLFFLAGALVGGVLGITQAPSFENYIPLVVTLGSVVIDAIICIFMIRAKNLGFAYWFLALLSCALAAIGGGLLGLIIPAYMTTRERATIQNS
jgi:hypothetical protein